MAGVSGYVAVPVSLDTPIYSLTVKDGIGLHLLIGRFSI